MPETGLKNGLKTGRDQIAPYVTKDGSVIRELMHPDVHGKSGHGNRRQSLAEATIPPGGKTLHHVHDQIEELYHVTAGNGVMTLGENRFDIHPGDTVCIPPGTPHSIENTENADLIILCCCAPAYSHADTKLVNRKSL